MLQKPLKEPLASAPMEFGETDAPSEMVSIPPAPAVLIEDGDELNAGELTEEPKAEEFKDD